LGAGGRRLRCARSSRLASPALPGESWSGAAESSRVGSGHQRRPMG